MMRKSAESLTGAIHRTFSYEKRIVTVFDEFCSKPYQSILGEKFHFKSGKSSWNRKIQETPDQVSYEYHNYFIIIDKPSTKHTLTT